MRIIISGGTGFIGTALTKSLLEKGHLVWILTRNLQTARMVEGAKGVGWDGRTDTGLIDLVSQADAIVNLAGESIGSGRWSVERKKRILTSRVETGEAISTAVRKANPRPKVLIQASAVGFYGTHGNEPVVEETPPGSGFLAEVCKKWEASTRPVEEWGVRRAIIRTGIVLARDNGALPRMMLPFKLFGGGPLGNGRQGIPWIHLVDEVDSIRFLVENGKARGVFNLSAPKPLSNADFGRILAKVVRRPYWFPVPGFALRLLLGEMASLVLEGQFLIPKRLLEAGYKFRFEKAGDALDDLLKR
jgi:uncharacterized protein (TIGR01777 family)